MAVLDCSIEFTTNEQSNVATNAITSTGAVARTNRGVEHGNS